MHALRSFIDLILYPFRMLARIPSNVISSPRRMLGLSLPMRTALLLFFCLLTLAIVRWIFIWRMEQVEQFSIFFRGEILPISLLVLAVPCVVWYALKLWLEGEPSPFPDIDAVWNEALKAMSQNAINPSEVPIFLVLGPANANQANSFMEASNQKFSVQIPGGSAPLHVFANTQSIYIVCTECCCVSQLLATAGAGGLPAAEGPPAQGGAGFDPTKTMQVGSGAVDPYGTDGIASGPPAPISPFGANGTVVAMPKDFHEQASFNNDIQGTMMVGMGQAQMPSAQQPQAAVRASISDSSTMTAKLKYLCRSIRRARDPLCPINGVLVSTPFRLLADGMPAEVTQLQTAIKSDLDSLRSASRIRCSVIHIISGMEEEPGFRELVRRVGANRAATQRFGKSYGLWNPAKADQLDAVVRHACGAFEDWSYLLFREEDGLSKRGNRHLYRLLCRIRSNFLPRLAHLIQASYALDLSANAVSGREPLLFSGCYFAASGQTPDRQAFLASIFRKSRDEEEELEWGSEAIAEENRMQMGVRVLLILNGIFVATLLAMLLWYYKFNS